MRGWKNHKERNKGKLDFLTSEDSFCFCFLMVSEGIIIQCLPSLVTLGTAHLEMLSVLPIDFAQRSDNSP